MAVWKDYSITCVTMEKDGSPIVSVGARKYVAATATAGAYLTNPPTTMTRQGVIDAIAKGTTFNTATWNASKNLWDFGADVQVVVIDGQKFIKTVADKVKKDNLGALPKC